jgi:hypothetical protein
MFLAGHLRAQIRLALGALLVQLALLCELLCLAVRLGLGGGGSGGALSLRLGCSGTLGLGLLGCRAISLLALALLFSLLLGGSLFLRCALLLLGFFPRRLIRARLLFGLLLG